MEKELLESDIDELFLEEFRKLVKKYGRDFAVPPIQIVKVGEPQKDDI